jgi:hypothetical protein
MVAIIAATGGSFHLATVEPATPYPLRSAHALYHRNSSAAHRSSVISRASVRLDRIHYPIPLVHSTWRTSGVILFAPGGFLLVRRGVYLSIQRESDLPVCNERFGRPTVPYFQPMVRPTDEGPWYLAEDFAFRERARRSGFKVWADTRVGLWHVGTYRYGWEDAGIDRARFDHFQLDLNPPGD